jgi:hypothetical protein
MSVSPQSSPPRATESVRDALFASIGAIAAATLPRVPVAFPSAVAENLERPDASEARLIAGGVAGAVALDGHLTGLQRLMIEAVTESMTGFVVPATALPRISPEPFAAGMRLRGEMFRRRMLHFMLLAALVLDPLPEVVVMRIEEYAEQLGVDDDMVRVAQRFARHTYGLALVDFDRSGYMQAWDPSHSSALHTSRELQSAWEECVRDDALAARWNALRELPDDTLGRAVARFYDARGFVFPGAVGSAPPLLAQHDWVHVLAGYGSTVEAEIEVFAFIARSNDDPRAFSLLAQVISLFETGYAASGMGLFQYDRGHLSHEGMAVRLADALRRGALAAAANGGVDLLALDWFALAELSLADARAQLGVPEKDARAVDAGSVTAWEAGGISPYQYDAGRRAAEQAGRDFDSYGASPPTIGR